MPDPRDPDFWAKEASLFSGELSELIMLALLAGAGAGIDLLPPNLQALIGWDFVNQAAIDFLRSYSFEWIKDITEVTRRQTIRAIEDWIRSGEPLRTLETRLAPIFGDNRARSIAATEVTRVYASGNMLSWQSTGFVNAKKWQTAMDERVCPICGPLHGKIVSLEGNFSLGPGDLTPELMRRYAKNRDSFTYMQPPAHPNCLLPGNEIMMPGWIEAATKSFYNGPAVEITLSSGSKFSVTENHPILTRNGWVLAKYVYKGMDLMGCADAQIISSLINPNANHIPIPIEKIWEFLEIASPFSTIRMPLAPKDFYGDARFMNGDVEIVRANSFLRNSIDARKHIDHFLFKRPDSGINFLHFGPQAQFSKTDLPAFRGFMSSGDLIGSLNLSHFRPFQSFGFGLSSGLNSSFNKYTSYGKSSNVGSALSNSVHRLSTPVSLNNQLFIKDRLALMRGSIDIDSKGLNTSGYGLDANPPILREFCERFSSLITPRNVINVRKFNFSGHVYDLQSFPYGLFIVNDIILRNCRCWLLPVVSVEGLREAIRQGFGWFGDLDVVEYLEAHSIPWR